MLLLDNIDSFFLVKTSVCIELSLFCILWLHLGFCVNRFMLESFKLIKCLARLGAFTAYFIQLSCSHEDLLHPFQMQLKREKYSIQCPKSSSLHKTLEALHSFLNSYSTFILYIHSWHFFLKFILYIFSVI